MDGGGGRELTGVRVLAVEDEATIRILLECMLEDLGCEVAGTAGAVNEALALARSSAAEVAVLDVNLQGEKVYPVAECLAQRHIPIVFASGYGTSGVEPQWRDCAILAKPYQEHDLAKALMRALTSTTADKD